MDQTGMSLMQVVRLREGIKVVVRDAERINVDAINSMLRARIVGKQALGFSVSSGELRRFASQLNTIMAKLGEEIRHEVKNVAVLLVNAKMVRYMHLAGAKTRQRTERIRELIREKDEESARILATVMGGQNRLRLSLQQASKICQIGLSVTRALKIEAAYGGAMAGQLRQVADAIEERIDNLFATVKEMAYAR